MKKDTNFRFITTYNKSALLNMAIDKTLLNSFNHDEKPIIRFYTWEKSFTVGISQKPEDYAIRYPDFKKNYAKRMTGGGTLFHGHDLSYSLIIPTSYLEGLNVKQSYEKICTFLLNFYKNLGLDAKYAKDDENITLSKSEFCQVGFEAYDIIVNGLKIGGNAQKRSKKFIFQHGSIPIKKVNNKIELGNCLQDFDINISYDQAMIRLSEAFENTFEVNLIESTLSSEEQTYLNKMLEE